MDRVKVNQVYVAPMMGDRILRRVRILAPHPDGGYIIEVTHSASGHVKPNEIQKLGNLPLERAYRLETDVCEHRHTEDVHVDVGEYSSPVPNAYKCIDCGSLFPNTGDTALWFPKPLELKVESNA